ncbi:hypothetical protein [Bacillus sp. ISL-55]|uniref:hypothetical protein n=1 Tax=Bacillus sp. ISL-55 TaxID=2819134 RepID=UPI001BE6D9E7|nr:hypothetical protein [Bacillus sp. ISL-55]MBT2694623.1 hypothetical protein [Bacillus sp. ISL-55]
MYTQNHNSQLEQTNYQDFDLIYKAINSKGIYLLEYHDSYLKDAFVTQLTEQFIGKGSQALFVQEEQQIYKLKDLFLSRMLFKQNPHNNYFSVSEIKQESQSLLFPLLNTQVKSFISNTKIITPHSHQPHVCDQHITQSLEQNHDIKFVIWDSHTDYFYKSNLVPELLRIMFNYKVTVLITSKISIEIFINKYPFLPAYLQSSLYLHSKHPNLFSLSNLKDVAYEFQLDVRTALNNQTKNHFTLRPASAYCQVG